MRSLRVLSCCLSVMLLVGPLSAPAQASGYDSVIDITFPTRQGARYADDYFTSRGSGRVHRATDLLGERGWPVFAAKSGVVAWSPDYEHASAGWALQIRGRGGRVFGYYHLGPRGGSRSQAIASGVRQGTRVQRGQVIGYLGDSGNAGGTAHLHFEISDGDVRDPYGGNRLNPYASLRGAERRGDYAGAASGTASRSGSGRSDGLLRVGDRGTAVARWQRRLNLAQSPNIGVDGDFGPITSAATRQFQRARGLAADGVVGPLTRAAMAAALGSSGSGGAPSRSGGGSTSSSLLRRGDRGPAVAGWQGQLNGVGRYGLATDGVFGPLTDTATRSFQRRHDLTSDGIVGPLTRGAMAGAR